MYTDTKRTGAFYPQYEDMGSPAPLRENEAAAKELAFPCWPGARNSYKRSWIHTDIVPDLGKNTEICHGFREKSEARIQLKD